MNKDYFSKRTQWEKHPNVLTQKKESLHAEGKALFDLTVSNPTACDFPSLNTKTFEVKSGNAHEVYAPDPRGHFEAREAIAEYYAEKGKLIDPDDIFITANTSEAYSFIFKLLMNPGNSLLVPAPSYPLIDHLCALHDVKTARYPLAEVEGWPIKWDKLEAARNNTLARALLCVNPNNPTGHYTTGAEREKLIHFLKEENMSLIVDEVFHDYPHGSTVAETFAGTEDVLTFTLSGISKVLALPQMKVSWLVLSGPEELKREAAERLEIIADAYLSASTPVLYSLSRWLRAKDKIESEIQARIQHNQRTLAKFSEANEFCNVIFSEGGWSAVLKVPTSRTDEEWALKILSEKHVVVHPGYFYDFSSENFLVLSLLVPEDEFYKGISKIFSLDFAPEQRETADLGTSK